ncbi:hypothetical protein EC968_008304 [Mortierella alpina]|nr:hypothetical protein EC968_008304 [Mortierella alpina]
MNGPQPTRASLTTATEPEPELEAEEEQAEPEAEAEPETQVKATTTASRRSDRELLPAIMQEHKIDETPAPITDKQQPLAQSTPNRLAGPRDLDRYGAGATLRQGDNISGSRPQLTIDTGVKNDRAIRNAVAGGLMSSPSSMFPAAYVAQLYASSPYNTSPKNGGTAQVGQSSVTIKRRSSRRGSVSGLVGRTGLVPAKAPTAQISVTTASVPATRDTSTTISRPDLHPHHHPLKGKGSIQPLRSMSYSGTTTASRTPDPPLPTDKIRLSEWPPEGQSHSQDSHPQHHHFPRLQKSKSFGIHSKKAFASQLRKLRQRRGSRGSTSGLSSAGESDAEILCDGQPKGRAGSVQKMSSGMDASKAGGHFEDPTLPPPPRMHANSRPERRDSLPSSIPAYAIPYGFGSMGSAPLSASTKLSTISGSSHNSATMSHGDPAKELSFATGRFRDMLKRNVVGLAGPGSPSGLHSPLSATALPQLDNSGGRKANSQSSSAIADLMFGDAQPSLFSISRIAGRRSRFNSKPNGEESGGGSPQGSEDDETPLSIRQTNPQNQKQPVLPHHRSRGAGSPEHMEKGPISKQQRVKVKPISQALKEARQLNPDPNVLYAEVLPLPGAFVDAFASHVGSPATVSSPMARPSPTPIPAPSTPLTTSMTAAVSKQMLLTAFPMTVGMMPSTSAVRTRTDSIPDSALSNPTTASTAHSRLQNSHRLVNRMSAGDPLGSRNFLFKSYLNSKFQGHYVFRVRDDQVEYGKLPISLEQACSLYFREADVTYRSLEKKAKLWKEEQRSAQSRREQARRITRQNNQSTSGTIEDRSETAIDMACRKDAQCEGGRENDISNAALSAIVNEHPQDQQRHLSSQVGEPLERQQRAMDEAYWQEAERVRWQESKEAIYGLEQCLWELVKRVEYERFDFIDQVEIQNENRDTALFSIANGDKTNIMWLESPSLKLKQEFLNWIAVSLMDHGDTDPCAEKVLELRRRGAEVNKFLKSDNHLEKRVPDEEAVDHILLMAEIRIHLMEADIRSKREETMSTMEELEAVLDKLDKLDDETKTLMTRMTRAIDSGEVQTALQPSLTTGMTLAETVQCKIRDVNERIIVCARIMGAARLNLNRLKYEIELEQRSIKLFRRYKIVIGIASLSVLFLAWLLYRRSSACAPAVRGHPGDDASTKEPLTASSYFAPHVPETTSPYFSNPVLNPFRDSMSAHPPPPHPHHDPFGKQSAKSDLSLHPDADTAVELEEDGEPGNNNE